MAGEDPDYIHWLHAQECACQPCASLPHDIEANHSTAAPVFSGNKRIGGKRGLGQRTHDRDAFPLCRKHHHQFTNVRERGFFKGWTREQVNAWQLEQSKIYRDRYEAARASESPPAIAHPDDKNLPRGPKRSGIIGLLGEARALCDEFGVPDEARLQFVRLVRRAAEWGTR